MIYIIGFLAQICFSARLLFQWIMSEKAKQVVSPAIFWLLSLIGAYLLFFYGWLRDDFAIIFGQLISYYIYIWNLNIKGNWKKFPLLFRYLLFLTPFAAIGYAFFESGNFWQQFFRNEEIPLWLLVYGSTGQAIFTLRFIYQWIYSQKRHESMLPAGFWIISLAGSLVIVSYAIVRHDPVLILGQSTGLLAYSRNLWILHRSKKENPESVSA